MKYLLIIFTSLFLSTGCDRSPVILDQSDSIENYRSITHFEYKGHDYIEFYKGFANASKIGIVHDPDCEKCNQIKK